MTNNSLLTTTQAAAKLGITPALIYRYISQGRLPHTRQYGVILITPAALAKFAKLPRKVGKRKKANQDDTQS